MKKGIWIEADVLHDQNLTPKEMLILSEIKQLTELDKGCFAMNAHFHKLLSGSKSVTKTQRNAIGNIINRLKVKGYIKITIKNRNNQRKIKLLTPPQNVGWGPTKCGRGPTKCGKSKESNTITNTTNTSKIENFAEESTPDEINPLIDLFKPINPSWEKLFKNKTQRAAIQNLVKKYPVDKVAGIIKSLAITNGMKYAPTITTPLQLEDKLGNLVAFWQSQKSNQTNIIAKV